MLHRGLDQVVPQLGDPLREHLRDRSFHPPDAERILVVDHLDLPHDVDQPGEQLSAA